MQFMALLLTQIKSDTDSTALSKILRLWALDDIFVYVCVMCVTDVTWWQCRYWSTRQWRHVTSDVGMPLRPYWKFSSVESLWTWAECHKTASRPSDWHWWWWLWARSVRPYLVALVCETSGAAWMPQGFTLIAAFTLILEIPILFWFCDSYRIFEDNFVKMFV